jgi:hypothetical protein
MIPRAETPAALPLTTMELFIMSPETYVPGNLLAHMTGDFSARDVLERCPNVGIDLIRRILRNERKAGRLGCLGRGPDAKWKRV